MVTDAQKDWYETSQTYITPTLEGSTNNFKINITYNTTKWTGISAYLIYNATSYSGTKTDTGGYSIFSRDTTAPITSGQSNLTFYWLISLVNATGNFSQNSTFNNQSVNNLAFDNCTSNTFLVLNYTLKDEKTQDNINATDLNVTIEIDLQLYSLDWTAQLLNYSNKTTFNNYLLVCSSASFSSSSQYSLFAQTRYSAIGYIPEFHYFQNYTVLNSTVPQHIKLFDLLSADSTEFLITYRDNTFSIIEGAILNLNRKYVSEGIFKSVEMAKTDSNGQAKLHLDTAGIDYSITVTKNGKLLSTFNSIAAICKDIVIRDCPLDLRDTISRASTLDFYTFFNLAYYMYFNQTTRTMVVDFSTLDGSTSTILLNNTIFDGRGNTSVCSTSLASSSGQLSCLIPQSYGNLTFVSRLYKDGKIVTSQIYTIKQTAKQIFGDNSVILVLGLFLTLPLMFIPSTIAVLIGGIVGLAISIILLGISRNLIGQIAPFMWFIIITGIIIWKIHQRGSD